MSPEMGAVAHIFRDATRPGCASIPGGTAVAPATRCTGRDRPALCRGAALRQATSPLEGGHQHRRIETQMDAPASLRELSEPSGIIEAS